MSTRFRLLAFTAFAALVLSACNNPMRPRQELDVFCKALGVTENDPGLRASHAAQMAAIQEQLRQAKVTPDFAKLVKLATPLHPTEIHDALQGYADIKGIKYSCTKMQQQRRRRDVEKQERLKKVREDGGDEEDLAAAALDPTYKAPFDVKAVKAKVDAHLQSLR